MPFLPSGLRAGALLVVLAGVLASPRAVTDRVTRADSPSTALKAPASSAAAVLRPLVGVRPTPVTSGTPSAEAARCSVAVAYPDNVRGDQRVTLTDLVTDRACPAEINTTVGLTFEVENPKPGRSLWWRRAEASFDVLYPSSGSIPAAGRTRVSLSSLVLDQTVTIEVLEGDQRLMSFTVKHF